jgi:hypothetical protein
MKAPFKIAWRVSDRIWRDETHFDRLMASLQRHDDVVDEMALFINEPSNYVYDPLQRVAGMADVFRQRAAVLRAAGITAGINFWPSFGSGSAYEKSPLRPALPFPPVVGMDGSVEDSIACPLSAEFLAYTREKYTVAAQAGPSFIWVDDDTRFTHLGGVPYPCFCDRCVSGFQGGRFASRESLVAQLNAPENRDLRRRWSAYGADRLAQYCAVVRAAVDAVDPAIDTPFMTVGPTHTTYAGDFIEKCMAALRSRRGRPGHGFYWDDRPEGMLHKAMEVGRQTARYPDIAVDVLYEEESYPSAYLDKAVQTRLDEVWLALAAGCSGVAFNCLSFAGQTQDPDMFTVYHRQIEDVHRLRPAWSRYVEFTRDLPWQGFWPADNPFLMAGMDCSGDGWFREDDPAYAVDAPEQAGQMGLPLTADSHAACGTLLAGKVIATLSEETLRGIFSKGVLMDVEALKVLQSRGLESWAGVRAGTFRMFARERCTAHRFNGPFAGYERFSFSGPAYDLHPLVSTVDALAVSVDAYDVVYEPCMTLYENALGGKVVVCGYAPWRFLGHPCKLWQFRALSDWMGGPLSLRWPNPSSIARVSPWIRGDGRRAAVLLVNASLDASLPCDLLLRGTMTRAELLQDDGTATDLRAQPEGAVLCVSVPEIPPWRPLVVLAE